MVQILPGVDEYLRPGIEKLGDTISLFTETDRRTQKAIRNMLLENPNLVQSFADLEVKSPGSLKKMGFGPLADSITKVGPSMALQKEQLLGQRELEVEEAELGLREYRSNLILTELERDPTISAVQMGALISEALGIPRTPQLEGEILDLIPKELQAQRAQMMIEAAARGENVEGSVHDFVALFRSGKDDPMITSSLLAHPTLGPQFESIMELQNFRENANLQRELAQLRVSSSGSNISAAIQREINMANDLKGTMTEVERLLGQFPDSVGLKFVGPEILNARLDPDGVRLRAAIAGLSSTLFHLRSGTAVTANEKTRLEPLTPNKFDTHETVASKLQELRRFFDDYIRNRQGLIQNSGGSTTITGPNEVVRQLIDSWILNGVNDSDIKQRLRDMNIDLSGGFE